jgi:EmrB/QacA subfamily drug resistance transporter
MDKRKRLTLIATILGSAIVFIDSTVVNVALPALRDDLNASLAEQQWVVEAYLLMLGSLVLVGGSLGDLYGRRMIFSLGVGGFGLTSLLCAVAPSAEFLIGARVLQGIAGALLVPTSLAIITDVFDGHERSVAIGYWTGWTSAAIAVGPLLGGFLVDSVSWRLVFAINIPLVLVCLWLTQRAVPPCQSGPKRSVDVVGGALCALGLAGPVFALIQAPDAGWASAEVIGGLLAGVVFLSSFVWWESRHPDPMLPLAIFKARDFSVANIATVGIYAGLGAASFFIAIFLQQVGGYTALAAGFALFPVTVIMVTLSSRAGALAEKVGPRPLMSGGPFVAAVGFLLWLRVGSDPNYWTDVLPCVILFGLGLAATVTPLTATVLASAEHKHAGIASGVNNAIARVAGLLAIAIVGAVVAGIYSSNLGNNTKIPPSVLQQAERRPFVLPSQIDSDSKQYDHASEDSSVTAFHWGMAVSAILVAAGGVVALVGLRDPRSTITGHERPH